MVTRPNHQSDHRPSTVQSWMMRSPIPAGSRPPSIPLPLPPWAKLAPPTITATTDGKVFNIENASVEEGTMKMVFQECLVWCLFKYLGNIEEGPVTVFVIGRIAAASHRLRVLSRCGG